MMNSWSNEYGMLNHNSMGGMNQMIPPLMSVMPEVSQTPILNAPKPLIGPVLPDSEKKHFNEEGIDNMEESKHNQESRSSNRSRESYRNDRRDRNYDRDRQRRRSRSRDRSRRDRSRDRDSDKSINRNDRNRRDRPSKWSRDESNEDIQTNLANLQMMTGMMQYNMMNNSMAPQQMEMGNMGNVIPGLMDPNMLMMNQQMITNQQWIPNQQIFISIGVLIPPMPGTPVPNRRQKPDGCRTIFVGGLPHGINDDVINEIFMTFGLVSDTKLQRQGVYHVRFEDEQSIENAFLISGYRLKLHDQFENEATTLFIDYALNRDDQNDYEKNKRYHDPTPKRIESFNQTSLATAMEKIRCGEEFPEVAHTIYKWLERGECNRKHANSFYSLIQAANNHVRKLFSDKMQLDEEFQEVRSRFKEKYLKLISQFEQVAKILIVAKHQRVSAHFNRQQQRNIEMWFKMTEEVENIKDEFNIYFDDEETDKIGKNTVTIDKYEELKKENEHLMYELEGYRNEAHLARDEAERKFEKFKAQFIAQQALMNPKQVYPPMPPPPMPILQDLQSTKPDPHLPTADEKARKLPNSDAKIISVLTAFLLVHPLGVTLDNIASYVKSILPVVSKETVNQILRTYSDVFFRKTIGYYPNIEHKWSFATFDQLKSF